MISLDPNLKVVVKEWPIFGEDSIDASRVSKAVSNLKPDAYHEFHTRLMRSPGRKTGEAALKIADLMDIDLNSVETFLSTSEADDSFRDANRLAEMLGANGTPTYVIGDQIVYGAVGVEQLREHIEEVRQ